MSWCSFQGLFSIHDSSIICARADYWVEGRLDEFFEGFMVKDILGRLKVPLLILQANLQMGMINHVDVDWVKSLMAELSHVFL